MTPRERLLTTAQAAEWFQVSDETVRRWVEAGLIRHIRLPSGQVRFDPADIQTAMTPIEAKDEKAG